MKKIWKKQEIAIADELQTLVPNLIKEFLSYHSDFDTTFSKSVPYARINAQLDPREKDIWNVESMRYALPDQNIEYNPYRDIKIKENFPTAVALTEKYIEVCGCSGYSILEPGGIINRHIDKENRDRSTVRIHIPLIVPDGDVFLEVDGVQLDWSEIFAFDNRELHSAHNQTDKRRLIYIIDIKRSFLKIPESALSTEEQYVVSIPSTGTDESV